MRLNGIDIKVSLWLVLGLGTFLGLAEHSDARPPGDSSQTGAAPQRVVPADESGSPAIEPVQPAAALDPAGLFRYDGKAPLNVKEAGSERQDDVVVRDISFAGAAAPIKAYLVSPTGRGPFAGILYVHWLGEPSTTNRKEFLKEAIALAPKGTVALLIDAMWAEPGWYKRRDLEQDYENSIRQVLDLRRALDVLLSQPSVDPKRIAFVGHDFGAMYGAVMGAVDPRPKTYVLMAGTISFNDWYLYGDQPKDVVGYKKQMSVLDPVSFVGKIKSASVFFQFANSDEYVTADATLAFYKEANPRKYMATYSTDHSLVGNEVDADRMNWLMTELDLGR